MSHPNAILAPQGRLHSLKGRPLASRVTNLSGEYT